MALTDLLKSFTRGVTLGAALYSCGGEEREGCSTDYDCREPRVCVRGYCEGGNGGNNNPAGGDICQEYQDMCPFEYDGKTGRETNRSWSDYNDCADYCNGNWESSDVEGVKETCGFLTCALETGYCDNQVRGDPQILTCKQEHDWR